MLQELGIVAGQDKKASGIFEAEFSNFMEIEYKKPSDYIKNLWDDKKLKNKNKTKELVEVT